MHLTRTRAALDWHWGRTCYLGDELGSSLGDSRLHPATDSREEPTLGEPLAALTEHHWVSCWCRASSAPRVAGREDQSSARRYSAVLRPTLGRH
jgi:hypothetical protein